MKSGTKALFLIIDHSKPESQSHSPHNITSNDSAINTKLIKNNLYDRIGRIYVSLNDTTAEEETANVSLKTEDVIKTSKKINADERQGSFMATRDFFANQGGGLIISPKKYNKEKREGARSASKEHNLEDTTNFQELSNRYVS